MNMEISDQCKDFIRRCLTKDLYSRPAVKQLLEHPWIKEGHRLIELGCTLFESELGDL